MSKKQKKQNRKQKENKNKDLSIVTEIKEPFSFKRFFDEKIVDSYNSFRKKLEERGILFFLISPFQYRNRLLLILWSLLICVVIGLVPRSLSLIDEKREENNRSEIASIAKKTFVNQKISIKALASSHYQKQHVIVFSIAGETKNGVPSTDKGYNVELYPLRNVSDEGNVKYRYKIIPLDASNRLLVLYIDNRNQNDSFGVFGLNVAIKDEPMMDAPIELTISITQQNTSLFNQDGINLSLISNLLTSSSNDKFAIKKAKEELDAQLKIYKLTEERLLALDIKLDVTYDKMKELVNKELILENINDESTTEQVNKIWDELPKPNKISVGLIYQNSLYTESDYMKDNKKDANSLVVKEYTTVKSIVDNINAKLNNYNNVKFNKYKELQDLSRIIKKELSVDNIGNEKTVQIKK